MFRTIFGTKQVRMGKTQKQTNNRMACFGLIEENMKLCYIHLAVRGSMRHQKVFEPLCRAVDSAVQWWQPKAAKQQLQQHKKKRVIRLNDKLRRRVQSRFAVFYCKKRTFSDVYCLVTTSMPKQLLTVSLLIVIAPLRK